MGLLRQSNSMRFSDRSMRPMRKLRTCPTSTGSRFFGSAFAVTPDSEGPDFHFDFNIELKTERSTVFELVGSAADASSAFASFGNPWFSECD